VTICFGLQGAALSSPARTDKSLVMYPYKTTWEMARDKCRADGGDLATIVNSAENTAVLNMFSYTLWIGLNDRATEGSFTWVDGAQSTFRDWYPQEPDNFNSNEDCTALGPNEHKWNDLACDEYLRFLCASCSGADCQVLSPSHPHCLLPWFFCLLGKNASHS
jgi:hypothetical protein